MRLHQRKHSPVAMVALPTKKIFGTKHKPTILQSFRFGCGKSGGVWRDAMDSHFASSWLKSLSNKLESLAEWSWVAERSLVWSFIGWYGIKINRVHPIKKGLTPWGSCLEEPSKISIRWFSDLAPKSWPINQFATPGYRHWTFRILQHGIIFCFKTVLGLQDLSARVSHHGSKDKAQLRHIVNSFGTAALLWVGGLRTQEVWIVY